MSVSLGQTKKTLRLCDYSSQTAKILSVSGGKDSTAMILLAREQGIDCRYVFADKGNENQAVYDYLDYLESTLDITIERLKADFSQQIKHKRHVVRTKWVKDGISDEIIQNALSVLHPTGIPFLDLCLWKGRFPSTLAAFCTIELKKKTIEQQAYQPLLLDGFYLDSWIGVRALESAKRAKYPMREPHNDPLWDGVTLYRPILNWTADDVFAMHRKHNIKPNPLYLQGMSRVGCMTCINANKAEIREIANRFPAEIERIKEWEALVGKASRRACATFFSSKSSAEKIMHIERVVQWSRTAHGGKQFGLFEQVQQSTGCASSYGLCDAGGDWV